MQVVHGNSHLAFNQESIRTGAFTVPAHLKEATMIFNSDTITKSYPHTQSNIPVKVIFSYPYLHVQCISGYCYEMTYWSISVHCIMGTCML